MFNRYYDELVNNRTIMTVLMTLILFVTVSIEASAKEINCFNDNQAITPEEQRIKEVAPIPQYILKDSNFAQYVERFQEDICSASSLKKAQKKVNKHGTQLWENAVKQAQGKGPQTELDRYDG